jgi:alpha-L-fucosidase
MEITLNKFYLFLFFAVLILFILGSSVRANDTANYSAEWESLNRHQTPEWFEDAKFGIFIHWGVYSVPAWGPLSTYAEWYPRYMYEKSATGDYHTNKYGKPSEFGYKDFIPMFRAEKWDPTAWAELFAQSGAKLVVPVAEHHDGFAMWDSAHTKWDAMDKGPKRDIIGELATAVRAKGMKYAPSYHRERHFSYFRESADDWPWGVDDQAQPFAGVKSEIKSAPESEGLYGPFHLDQAFIDDYAARWEELVEKYQPDMMWIDDIPVFYTSPQAPEVIAFQARFRKMIADYLNKEQEWGVKLAVNNKGKVEANFPRDFGLLEADYHVAEGIPEKPWISSRGTGRSYGINLLEEPNLYPSLDELVENLVDIVSKNGFFLLNVGPHADGTISKAQTSLLLGIGDWLKVNGEAIYSTRPWKIFGDSQFRYTKKGNDLYVFATTWPGRAITIPTDLMTINDDTKITFLQTGKTLKWKKNGEKNISLALPMRKSSDPALSENTVYVFKIEGAAK